MSPGQTPLDHGWWLASRAAGVTALVCIAAAVLLGLALASKSVRRPGVPRVVLAVHEHAAVAGLIATAVHGITLLGDGWLKANLVDIAVPFASDHEPLWTGLGVVGGYLAALLGLTFHVRKRIGPKLWRKAHRATVLVYVLAVAHTVGAGTDATELWMQALLVVTGVPILYLLVLRMLPPERKPAAEPA